MKYTIAIAVTFICDLALFCANMGLWLVIHIIGDLILAWLMKNSVYTD